MNFKKSLAGFWRPLRAAPGAAAPLATPLHGPWLTYPHHMINHNAIMTD